MLLLFIKAILIGLAASAPLGPLGIMCIQKTLSKGRWSGFAIGLGAAIGDTFYAIISLFSISFVSAFLDDNRDWVMFIGGLIILLLGLQVAIKNPIKDLQPRKVQPVNIHAQDVLRGLLMTLSNPGALVLMLGIFAFFGMSLSDTDGKHIAVAIVIGGILLGALAWWFLLSSGINLFRKRFRLKQMIFINRVSGMLIALLGLASLIEGIAQVFFHYSFLG